LKLHQDHRYYSNRSACYAGKEDWGAAKDDALECIKLSPGFIKGYYRLVTAHMNLGQFDEALQVAKSGLGEDGLLERSDSNIPHISPQYEIIYPVATLLAMLLAHN